MAPTEPTANGVTKAPESDSHSVPSDATAAAANSANETAPSTTGPDQAKESQNLESEPAPPTESGDAPASHNAVSTAADNKWPGWSGDCVFRLIVPVLKVGSIIGRKGELIKKMCEETRARIRVLDGAVGTPHRVVLISGKEEPEATLSPAMDAVLRIFKRVSGLSDNEASRVAGVAFCSIQLLVASTQAISLIGKQGLLIMSTQEGTGASVRVLSGAIFS